MWLVLLLLGWEPDHSGQTLTSQTPLALSDVSAVVVGVNVDANGFTMDSCEFRYNATGDDFITMIDIDAFDDAYISNCVFHAEETAGCSEAIRMDDALRTKIINCHFTGDFTDGAIIGEDAVSTGILIADNYIYNSDTTGGEVIDLNVASTGLIVGNRCGTLFPTAPYTAFDPGSCLCLENYVANAIDESGALTPQTVSST
jgi:hypothetical protein